MPFIPWTAINAGDKIEYDNQLTDLRDNADYLDDNAANITYNATVNGTQYTTNDSNKDNTVNPTQYSGNDTSYNPGYENGRQFGVDGTYHVSNLASYYPGLNSGQNLSADGTRYVTVYNFNYSANYGADYSSNNSSKR